MDPGLSPSVRASSLKNRLYSSEQTFLKSLLQVLHQHPDLKPYIADTVKQLGDKETTLEPGAFAQELNDFINELNSEGVRLPPKQAYALFDFINGDNPNPYQETPRLLERSKRQIGVKFFRFLVETYRHLGEKELLTTLDRSKSFLFNGLSQDRKSATNRSEDDTYA